MFGCADGAVDVGGKLDLAGVEYVNYRLLLALGKHARANGVALGLRSAPPFAARLLELPPTSGLHLAPTGAGV